MIKKLEIPIYDVHLYVCLGKTVAQNRKKLNDVFGESEISPYGCSGMCSSSGHNFGLFFAKEDLDAKLVAHEVFHLTHAILNRVGAKLGDNEDEYAALLNGWLMGLVFETLKLRIVNGNKHKNSKS